MASIYLDNNATTFLHPEVAAAMRECYRSGIANPASAHGAGRRARRIVEQARDEIAQLLGAQTHGMAADRLIFTSGGTESNNLALCGLVDPAGGQLVISAIEHPSVSGTADYLASMGFQVVRVGVDVHGVVVVDQLSRVLATNTRLVSVMLGNNETGVIQPITEIARRCREAGVIIHTDAIQAVGKIGVNFRSLGVDALSFSAHKFHGPPGIGALIVRRGVEIQPILHGGFQQTGLRPGTEPVGLIVGLRRALEIAMNDLAENQARVSRRRDRLARLLQNGWLRVVINGEEAPRLPHTLNVAFPGIDRQALVMALDMAGVECSSGSACASGSSEPSPVLVAMGLEPAIVEGSIRLSLSPATSDSDIDEAARRILKVVNDLQPLNPSPSAAQPPRKASQKTL